ncbi:MAG: heme-binding protein [Eubacterium sp.]
MTKTGKLLEMAKVMAAAAEKIDVPMVISVCDMGGNTVLVHRMEDTLLASVSIAQNKAYTAASLKMSSEEAGAASQPGGPLYGLANCCEGRMVIFGGGFPITVDGKLVGAIGVSGGSVDEDMSVARAGLAAL